MAADRVTWSASELTEPTSDPETGETIPPGVFITCRGEDSDDVRAVLRVEFAVTGDGGEESRELAARIADRLNASDLAGGGNR